MRTFHIGGIASSVVTDPRIIARNTGRVRYRGLRLVHIETPEGPVFIALNKTGAIQILDKNDRELEAYDIVVGSAIRIPDGEEIKAGAVLASWDPYNIPNLSEKAGTVRFRDMIRGVTIKKELDESSGRIATVIIEHKEDLNPSVEICDESGKVQAVYSIPTGAQVSVAEGDIIAQGALLERLRQASKTKDITGGLPRVAELFEAPPSEGSCGDGPFGWSCFFRRNC